MFEAIIGVVALASLFTAAAAMLRVRALEDRLRLAQSLAASTVVALDLPEVHPLEGLTASLSISQDHPLPSFARILEEQLLAEGVAEVSLVSSVDARADIRISGEVTCNGYAEIYYNAKLECQGPNGPLFTIIERPPHGDRPLNLAIEVVKRLRSTLGTASARSERVRSLRELTE